MACCYPLGDLFCLGFGVIGKHMDVSTKPERKLLVAGIVHLEGKRGPVEVERGMPILAQDGTGAGAVAAVVMDRHCHRVTHVLLGHVPPTAVYRLAPVSLIERIDGKTLWLRALTEEIEKLPVYQPD